MFKPKVLEPNNLIGDPRKIRIGNLSRAMCISQDNPLPGFHLKAMRPKIYL